MSKVASRKQFLESDKARELREELIAMVKDPAYNTTPRNNMASLDDSEFIDKHMEYMSFFPNLDHWQYISNLKLITKITR